MKSITFIPGKEISNVTRESVNGLKKYIATIVNQDVLTDDHQLGDLILDRSEWIKFTWTGDTGSIELRGNEVGDYSKIVQAVEDLEVYLNKNLYAYGIYILNQVIDSKRIQVVHETQLDKTVYVEEIDMGFRISDLDSTVTPCEVPNKSNVYLGYSDFIFIKSLIIKYIVECILI